MKRFLPVLHLKAIEHTHDQVAVAIENGADGVWLINHSTDNQMLTVEQFKLVRREHPDLWIGMNLLGIPAHAAMHQVSILFVNGERVDGLWADDSGIRDEGPSQKARNVWITKRETGWDGEYFGSVAFKAGPIIQDPPAAAKIAKGFMDVVTTSGTATGIPADLEKVRGMKEALGDHRLGVASGITPENVQDYLPFVDDFLVATGISRDFHTLDPAKVRALGDQIHEKA